jgi:hypothetical protein
MGICRAMIAGLLMALQVSFAFGDVNLRVQQLSVYAADLELAAPGAALRFARTYRPDAPACKTLGPPWCVEGELELQVRDAGTVWVRDCCNETWWVFRVGADGVFRSEQRPLDELRRMPDGFELRQDDGTVRQYNSAGHLLKRVDPHGHSVAFRWLDGRWQGAQHSSGAKISAVYGPGGHLIRVESRGVNPASYQFNDAGQLSGVESESGSTTYTYEGQLLSEIRGPERLVRASYRDGRLIETADERCKQTLSGPEPMGHDSVRVSLRQECQENADEDWVQINEYRLQPADLGGRPTRVRIQRGDGPEKLAVVDATGLKILSLGSGQESTEFRYDSVGRLIEKHTGQGSTRVEYEGKAVLPVRVQAFDLKGAPVLTMNAKTRQGRRTVELHLGEARYLMQTGVNGFVERLSRTGPGADKNAQLLLRTSANGKPSAVRWLGQGSIRISYKPSGEILKLSTSSPYAGMKVAAMLEELNGPFERLNDELSEADYSLDIVKLPAPP